MDVVDSIIIYQEAIVILHLFREMKLIRSLLLTAKREKKKEKEKKEGGGGVGWIGRDNLVPVQHKG